MKFSTKFISAGIEYSNYDRHIPAPYFRKVFELNSDIKNAHINICGLGFYELYINEINITKGSLAPYITNPDDVLYYDYYDITPYLTKGKNVIGIILGNGMQNAFSGDVWDFDKPTWRSSPKVAFSVEICHKNDETTVFESDTTLKTFNSPILYDDLRTGEIYDANMEIKGWNSINFDDENWNYAINAQIPSGEPTLCECEPIIIAEKLSPVNITKQENGFLYDFGVNDAGICTIKIFGTKNQKITMSFGENIVDKKLDFKNIQFSDKRYIQRDIYICKGNCLEEHTPIFTYHGFRYVFVEGITDQQATENLLVYNVMHSDLREIGNFECSDEVLNKLQKITRRSVLSNFYYFPTDCPHREKNGWTADIALSCEHTLLNLSAEKSYENWLKSIRKAQNEFGALPGIIPTGGWGFEWGNGPAWDCVLTYVPYFVYLYRSEKKILSDNANAIFKYLNYLTTQINENGLIAIGLGDWCPVNKAADDYDAPLEVTDTIISMDIAKKAMEIFEVLEMDLQKEFAKSLYEKLRNNIRNKLINKHNYFVLGNCQTSQAMALYYGVFTEDEIPFAFNRLIELIEEKDYHLSTGVLGGRVIFHTLSKYGCGNIAYKMITNNTFPSYADWVNNGATTLFEEFKEKGKNVSSLNHHFWGDISGWFIKAICGINLIFDNKKEIIIAPSFIDKLNYAKAYHTTPLGKIRVKWGKTENIINLKIDIPDEMTGKIILPKGYVFQDENTTKILQTKNSFIISAKFNS